MVIRVDPEQNEMRLLRTIGIWRDKEVIEIGCGDGRLTLRLARLGPKLIQAIDPAADLIRSARKKLPVRPGKQIHYKVGLAEALKYPSKTFDIAVFSWVL